MKTKYILPLTVLTLALVLSMFGQPAQDDKTKTAMKQHDPSSMMGKPTVDATVDGLHMKVWLITQEQHKDMMKGMKDSSMEMGAGMKGMKHDGMGMNKAMRDSMMAGTHHIMLEATDAAIGQDIASAKVVIMSPSKTSSSVELKHMMGHFGSALTLKEKGEYGFTVDANVGGVSKTTQFKYTVK
jgi:hypothetical protein